MKVRDLITILGAFDGDSEISIERLRRSAVASVIEADLLDIGIKQFNMHDSSSEMPRRSYAIYPAAAASTNDASPHAESSALSPTSVSPTSEGSTLEPDAASDESEVSDVRRRGSRTVEDYLRAKPANDARSSRV